MKPTRVSSQTSFRKSSRAISPAISTIILTSAIVVLLLITILFANNFLSARLAQSDFSAMQQVMQTAELQLDDVAWTIGRTQTIRYASKSGQVSFQPGALSYSIYTNSTSPALPVLTNTTGIILFNMPVNKYSISNNYFQRQVPSSDSSFLQSGASAPIAQVFTIEKVPMADGSYIRVVLAPSIRMLNSTITGSQTPQNYYEFYLPCLVRGSSPLYSQSITMATQNVAILTAVNVTSIMINVTFLNAASGFNSAFFNFKSTTWTVKNLTMPNIVEFYSAEVIVSLGLYP
jgi:hypothetical protein